MTEHPRKPVWVAHPLTAPMPSWRSGQRALDKVLGDVSEEGASRELPASWLIDPAGGPPDEGRSA